MHWPVQGLGVVASVFNGKTPSRDEQRESGHPVLKIKDVDEQGCFKGTFDSFVEDSLAASYSEKVVKSGDTLILNAAHNADYVGSKQFYACNEVDGALATGEWCIVRPNREVLDAQYASFFLQSGQARHEIRKLVKGIHLYPKDVARLEIPLPPLTTQQHIARVLEQADQLRKQAQQMERELNQLAQSLFLEMFGDPVSNPMGWQSGTIDDIAVPEKGAVRCGPFGTQLKVNEITDSGIPLLGIENIVDDQLQDNFEKFLTPTKAKELKAFAVKPGDVLITRMGTIGRACVVPDSMGEARISYHLFRVRVDENKCLPKFLLATISRSGTFQQQLSRLAHGAIMAGLNTGVLRQVRFLIPPKKMQQDYIRASDEIEALKKSNEHKAQELDAAFQALMQRAFNGELTAPERKAA